MTKIVFLVIMIFFILSRGNSQPIDTLQGYMVFFKCCFNDSAIIKYEGGHQRIFLNTNESIEMDNTNFFYYPSDTSTKTFEVSLKKTSDIVLRINLIPVKSARYVSISRDNGKWSHYISDKMDKLR